MLILDMQPIVNRSQVVSGSVLNTIKPGANHSAWTERVFGFLTQSCGSYWLTDGIWVALMCKFSNFCPPLPAQGPQYAGGGILGFGIHGICCGTDSPLLCNSILRLGKVTHF
ncbi:hypothetical protein KIL84_006996 [Mauremys mutica]|uniref:Uncharacterized protein n=1 Tax=Mauremys mutica TaxID=74926 RepID=A0A9D3X2F6_9SAUR|nr:hypothetical protein KIL84_006996 [Mauremys mutica]